jgi:hypothetical protein
VRPATPEERALYARERPSWVIPVWGAIIEENGKVVGHGFLSEINGDLWAHDLAHWGTDKSAVIRMFLAGRTAAKAAGFKKMFTDLDPEGNTWRMYARLGWQIERIVMKGEL